MVPQAVISKKLATLPKTLGQLLVGRSQCVHPRLFLTTEGMPECELSRHNPHRIIGYPGFEKPVLVLLFLQTTFVPCADRQKQVLRGNIAGGGLSLRRVDRKAVKGFASQGLE